MEKPLVFNKNKDFRRLYYRGSYRASPLVITYAVKSKQPALRFGITASKKVGNAVQRNRARRLIKEAFYSLCFHHEKFPDAGYDFVFIARSACVHAKMQQVRRDLQKQIFFLMDRLQK